MAAAPADNPDNMDLDTSRQPSTSTGTTKKRFEVKKVKHKNNNEGMLNISLKKPL